MLGHETHDPVMNTEMLAVGAAVFAKSTGERALDDDPVADFYLLYLGAKLYHLAETVVADRYRKKRKNFSPLRGCVPDRSLAHVEIAAIEPRPEDAHQNLALLEVRDRDLFDAQGFAQA